MCMGTAIGLVRGSRAAGLRFLAENAHRPPTTVRGWYFYKKTKNYKMMLGGLSKAGTDAAKLGFTALAWVTMRGRVKPSWVGGDWGGRCGSRELLECLRGCVSGAAQLRNWVEALKDSISLDRLPWRTASRAGILGVLGWNHNEHDAMGKGATGGRSSGAKGGEEPIIVRWWLNERI
jgi:hypothetical protein